MQAATFICPTCPPVRRSENAGRATPARWEIPQRPASRASSSNAGRIDSRRYRRASSSRPSARSRSTMSSARPRHCRELVGISVAILGGHM